MFFFKYCGDVENCGSFIGFGYIRIMVDLRNCHYFHFLWVLCVFTIFIKLPLYSLSMKLKMCFHFLYSNPTFRILKMKTKNTTFFQLTKQTLSFEIQVCKLATIESICTSSCIIGKETNFTHLSHKTSHFSPSKLCIFTHLLQQLSIYTQLL